MLDRSISLVARNVELKTKLNLAIHSLEVISETLHDVYKHTEPFAQCQQGGCQHGRVLCDKLRAS